MAGTSKGGKSAAQRNRELYGEDFYARIGAAGGRKSRTGGFAAGKVGQQRARKWGAVGGKISRRRPKRDAEVEGDQERKAA